MTADLTRRTHPDRAKTCALSEAVKRIGHTTGHSHAGLNAVVHILRTPAPHEDGPAWTDEQITRSLPAIAAMATTEGAHPADVAKSIRAVFSERPL